MNVNGPIASLELPRDDIAGDEELVARVLGGEVSLFAVLVRRYNERLFRAARSVVRDDREAEDVVQQAWVSAFHHLVQFQGEARFATWLTRIAINEALARKRSGGKAEDLEVLDDAPSPLATPEEGASRAEMSRILIRAIDDLPVAYRTVFVMRQVEELSTAETAAVLDLTEEAVRVRLHRARGQLRRLLFERVGLRAPEIFRVAGQRCDRIVLAVMGRVRL